jgi:hypothetical protein
MTRAISGHSQSILDQRTTGVGSVPPAQQKCLSLSTALALRRAIERRQCVVCAVQQRGFDRALFWFLEESYSEGPTINKLVESQGLCVNHTQLLLAPENHWQVNFICEVLTGYNWRLAGEALERAKAYRRTGFARFLIGRGSIGRAFIPRTDCPFCTYLRDWERWALRDLADFSDDPEVAAVSQYTCVPHVLMLIPLTSGRLALSLAEALHRYLQAIRAGDGFKPAQTAEFFLARYPRARRSAFLPAMRTELLTDARTLANAVSLRPQPHELAADRPDWDRLHWAECLLCQAVSAAEASRLEGEAYAFCRPHAAMLLAKAPGAATQQLMEWASLAIEQRLAQQPHRWRANIVKETTCPACRQRSENIAGVLAIVEKAAPDRLAQTRFCLPHLPLVLERVPPEAAVVILRAECDLLSCLHAELKEFFRKSDYRFQHEALGSEQTAWLRAADILAGSYAADIGYQSEFETTTRRTPWTTV